MHALSIQLKEFNLPAFLQSFGVLYENIKCCKSQFCAGSCAVSCVLGNNRQTGWSEGAALGAVSFVLHLWMSY